MLYIWSFDNVRIIYIDDVIEIQFVMTLWLAGGTNETNMVCGEMYGCPDDDFPCCFVCATYGLRGKCHKNECCCDSGAPMC